MDQQARGSDLVHHRLDVRAATRMRRVDAHKDPTPAAQHSPFPAASVRIDDLIRGEVGPQHFGFRLHRLDWDAALHA